jgi:hypothetical protein
MLVSVPSLVMVLHAAPASGACVQAPPLLDELLELDEELLLDEAPEEELELDEAPEEELLLDDELLELDVVAGSSVHATRTAMPRDAANGTRRSDFIGPP